MREYLLVFLVAGTATYLLTVIAREIALRTGAVAAVRDRDVHDAPIPYLGGLAMLGGLVAAYLVARELPFLSRSDDFVFRDAGVVLAAGALICAVGVVDDIFEVDALTKFGGQVLAAGLLVVFDVRFYYLPGSDGSALAVAHAAPDDTVTSLAIALNNDSPCTSATRTLRLFGRRGSNGPFKCMSVSFESAVHKRSRSGRRRAHSASASPRHSSAALPNPTIAGTFSVPER